jgi:uncharacterized membrane protein YeaQ/YmgE (transglycosylase-associated protein family)
VVVETSLLVTLVIGGIAGWLAGLLTRGSGYGLIGDVVVGLLGALIGSYLSALFNVPVRLGNPWLDKGAIALVGALLLMVAIGFFRPLSLHERVGGWWRRR